VKEIMVIKLGSLGDLVQAEGALRDIREHHAGDRITMLTTLPYRALGERCPWVDRVWIDPRAPRWRLDRLWRLRRAFHDGRFDMVYDLQNSPRTELYFRYLFPRVAWSGTASGCSHPHPRDDAAYGLGRLSDQLRPAGVPVRFAERPSLAWMVDDAGETLRRAAISKPFAVLTTGSSARNRDKRWPHFEQLALALRERDCTPVTVPGPDELASPPLAATLRLVREDGHWLGLFELAGVLARADFVIGNDTGPTHMAALLGVPGVVLLREPGGYAGEVLAQAGMTVLESRDLSRIPVGAVLAAIDRLDPKQRSSRTGVDPVGLAEADTRANLAREIGGSLRKTDAR
jgi:ADP-heptose:LPS heptosyltransferase